VTIVNKLPLSVERSQYPQPPEDFVASPNVESLWNRFEGYKSRKEPLLSMAFFCLTMIESIAGNRSKAGQKYRISRSVLDTLARLASRSGDLNEARKYDLNSPGVSLTGEERQWIETTIRTIIRRIGEHEAQPSRPLGTTTMQDLPSLTP
jgi:hypothetical protein